MKKERGKKIAQSVKDFEVRSLMIEEQEEICETVNSSILNACDAIIQAIQ